MAAKLTRLTNNIAIQLLLMADVRTICSSRASWPIRKLLDTPSYKQEALNLSRCCSDDTEARTEAIRVTVPVEEEGSGNFQT